MRGRHVVYRKIVEALILEPWLSVEEIARRVGYSQPYVSSCISMRGQTIRGLREQIIKEHWRPKDGEGS